MVETSFSDANILDIFSGGSLLPGHTVCWGEKVPPTVVAKGGVWLTDQQRQFKTNTPCSLLNLAKVIIINRCSFIGSVAYFG